MHDHPTSLAQEVRAFQINVVKSVFGLVMMGFGVYGAAVRGGMASGDAALLAILGTLAGISVGVVVVLWLLLRT